MREPDSWIDLTDFSPGIIHNLGRAAVGASVVGSAPAPDGAASIENTYRCITLPGGGLGPLPSGDWTYSHPTTGRATTYRVQHFVVGPMVAAGALSDPRSLGNVHPVDFLLGMEGITQSPTAHQHSWLWQDAAVWNVGSTMTAANVHTLLSQNVAMTAPFDSNYGGTWMIRHYLTLGVNNPTVIASWMTPDGGGSAELQEAWPDATSNVTVATNTPAGILGVNIGNPIVSHQGRFVVFVTTPYKEGASGTTTVFFELNDTFAFTTPQTYTQDGSTLSVVTQDAMTGVGIAASITASDLLIISHNKGAVLVQGDLANPTVRRMPSVQGTAGARHFGVSTPVGFVYGTNFGGIYAWAGGDSSQLLSPQLPDDCWIVQNNSGIVDYFGRFALWGDWIMCPGNWVYNIASGSWWRIDDPSSFLAYEWNVNPINGYCYGNRPQWVDTGSGNMVGNIIGYNRTAAAHSWSWQSQPLRRTRQRVVDIRDVDVVCIGAGTIALTFTAIDGTTQTQTYTLSGSATLEQTIRATFGVQGSDVKVRVLATGTGGSGAAPVLRTIHIGYNERHHVGAG